MRKLTTVLATLALVFSLGVNHVSAAENAEKSYLDVIEEVNVEYGQNFYVMSEKEYYDSEFYTLNQKSYEEYISNLSSMNLDDLRNELISSIVKETTVEVQCDRSLRSSYGSQTVFFNYSRNTMTLGYKYSGSTFDTSYKPTVKVERVLDTVFFVMDSYTGSFKNSNTRYTVVAKGYIVTPTGLANNQSFTVNFDL